MLGELVLGKFGVFFSKKLLKNLDYLSPFDYRFGQIGFICQVSMDLNITSPPSTNSLTSRLSARVG